MNGSDWIFYIGLFCIYVFVGIIGFLVGWML